MAVRCKYCGIDLPKDDARFCNKCGMLVSSRPLSSQSFSASISDSKISGPSSSGEQQERQKRVLREQVANLSPSRSKSSALERGEPAEKPDMRGQKVSEPETLQSNQASLAPAVVKELPLEMLPETPQPELEEDEPTQAVDMPTELEEDEPTQVINIPVEDVPTTTIPVPVEKQSHGQEQVAERVSSNSFVSSHEYRSATMSHSRSRGKENSPPIPAMRRPRRRWPIVVLVLLLLVLVIGGLGTATILSQQPGNSIATQPQVNFRNVPLGISLLYPNGWINQIDSTTSTTHFYASNHVGEVDIIEASNSGSVQQALQQQATKMGMSGKKTGAVLTFAGTSWQQQQGTMQVNGASYADTILATIHGSKLFIMVQQAPQNTYADWENEFFAPLRRSFKFL